MEPDRGDRATSEIRVLRFIEYRYETPEAMEEDMARWTTSSPGTRRPGGRRGWRMRMTSAHLPPQVVRGLFSATNEPNAAAPGPRPGLCPRCGRDLDQVQVPRTPQDVGDPSCPVVPGSCGYCGWPEDPNNQEVTGG